MHRRRITQISIASGGVALADILANSVAVLLILIFLSIQVKQQQAEQQVEQTVDMSILMARKLADSVVLDALPNSRPAFLHDYSDCSIAHDCNPSLYPIIEIYDTKVAIHHPRIYLTRSQMLENPSPFDIYMQSLSSEDIQHIRVDIYGIGMFYLAVAAMREYGAPLNHWHFLGEKQLQSQPLPSNNENTQRLATLLREGERDLLLEDMQEQLTKQEEQLYIPDGVDIADNTQLMNLESEVLLPPEELGKNTTERSNNSSTNANSLAPNTNSEQMLEELLGEFARKRGKEGQKIATNQGQAFHLRIPNFHSSVENPVELHMDKEKVKLSLLGFIFAALHDANTQLRFDPQSLAIILQTMLQDPATFATPVSSSFLEEIRLLLANSLQVIEEKIPVIFADRAQNTSSYVRMHVTPNSAIKHIELDSKQLYAYQNQQLEKGPSLVDVLLRAYPFIYKGERVAVRSNMLVLMLPENLRQSNERWRPVAFVTPDLQEITLGFLLSSYQNGQLQIALETNQVRANSQVLQTYIQSPQNRGLLQLLGSYAIALILIALLIGVCIRLRLVR